MGIRRMSGKAFPAAEAGREAMMLVPAGTHGPEFIVTPNFYVIKEYNNSDLYALFIGNLDGKDDPGRLMLAARPGPQRLHHAPFSGNLMGKGAPHRCLHQLQGAVEVGFAHPVCPDEQADPAKLHADGTQRAVLMGRQRNKPHGLSAPA